MRKITVIVPTAAEAEYMAGIDVRIVIGGVGMVETAAAVARVLAGNPDVVILAGIAGSYGDKFAVGQTVVVGSERTADCGAFRGERFKPLFVKEYHCPHVQEQSLFAVAQSNSVNAAGAGFIEAADIENMEGAAFFALCIEAGVRFFELRTISNGVGDLPQQWNIPLAVQNLGRDLQEFLATI